MDEFWIIFMVVAFLVFWFTPIYLGIKTAEKKNLSPHWMWFGLHPFLGWIAFIVLASVKPKIRCENCGEALKSHAKICAYCNSPFDIDMREVKPNKNDSRANKTPLTGIFLGVLMAIIFFSLMAVYILKVVDRGFSNSWPYQEAMELAQNDEYVIKTIGQPIMQQGSTKGRISTSDNSGSADLVIPIEGPKGSGQLYLSAEKHRDKWHMNELIFKLNDSNQEIVLVESKFELD